MGALFVLILWLIEAELLVLYDPRLTRGLSDFLGFPFFKVSVCFAGLLWLSRPLKAWPVELRFSWPAALGHIGYTATALGLASRLWDQARPTPGWRLGWTLLLLGFALTLAAALVTPRQWPRLWPGGLLRLAATGLAARLAVAITIPMNSWWSSDPGHTIAAGTYWFSVALCRLVSDDVRVFPDDRAIRLEGFNAQINDFCSGIEGMGLIWLYLSLYLWVRRSVLQFPRALLLIPLGMALSLVLNGFRLALLILVGARVSPELAGGGFHSHAGWIAFTLIGWLLIAWAERSGALRRTVESVPNPAWSYLCPFGAWLLACMLTQALSSHHDPGYPLRVILAGAALFSVRKELLPVLGRPGPASLVSGLLVYLIWLVLVPSQPDPDLHPSYWLGNAYAPWLVFRLIGTVVVVPIVEELAFRGFLLRRLQRWAFEQVEIGRLTPVAVLLSSLAFGMLHHHWLAATLAGMVYAATTRTRGGLAAAILAHGITNLCIAVQVLGWQHWSLW